MVIPILPSGLFALPGAALLENGYKFVGNFMLWLASIYLGLVFGLWSATVLSYVLVSSSTFWGSIFISFGVAIGPLIYMTSKNPIEDDEGAISNMLTNFGCEIALFLMILFAFIYRLNWTELVIVYVVFFSIISAIGMIIMSTIFQEN